MAKPFNASANLVQKASQKARSGKRPGEDNNGNFDLRDTLESTVVHEMSFAEFRAAMEKAGKHYA